MHVVHHVVLTHMFSLSRLVMSLFLSSLSLSPSVCLSVSLSLIGTYVIHGMNYSIPLAQPRALPSLYLTFIEHASCSACGARPGRGGSCFRRLCSNVGNDHMDERGTNEDSKAMKRQGKVVTRHVMWSWHDERRKRQQGMNGTRRTVR